MARNPGGAVHVAARLPRSLVWLYVSAFVWGNVPFPAVRLSTHRFAGGRQPGASRSRFGRSHDGGSCGVTCAEPTELTTKPSGTRGGHGGPVGRSRYTVRRAGVPRARPRSGRSPVASTTDGACSRPGAARNVPQVSAGKGQFTFPNVALSGECRGTGTVFGTAGAAGFRRARIVQPASFEMTPPTMLAPRNPGPREGSPPSDLRFAAHRGT